MEKNNIFSCRVVVIKRNYEGEKCITKDTICDYNQVFVGTFNDCVKKL